MILSTREDNDSIRVVSVATRIASPYGISLKIQAPTRLQSRWWTINKHPPASQQRADTNGLRHTSFSNWTETWKSKRINTRSLLRSRRTLLLAIHHPQLIIVWSPISGRLLISKTSLLFGSAILRGRFCSFRVLGLFWSVVIFGKISVGQDEPNS